MDSATWIEEEGTVMPESFESLARDTVEAIGEIAPCPLLVTDERGVVVGASPPSALGST